MAGENFEDAFATLIREDGEAAKAAGETGIKKPDMPNTPASAAAAPEAPAAAAAPEAPAAPAPAPAPAPAVAAAEGEEPVSEIENPDPENPEPPPPPEPAKNVTDEALARLADMLAQRQPPAPPARVETAPPLPPPFTAEEVSLLTQYQTDFPDVIRCEGLLRRAEYQQLTAHIYREMAAYFAPKLQLLEQLADGAAYSAITKRIPNYEAQRDAVAEWVKTQPAYLQTGMNHVIAQGTAEEIADLFGRFSQATGTPSPQAATSGDQPGGKAPPAPAAKPAAELSPAAKQAAARLAPVTSKRSAPTQAAPLTFEDAFDSYAKAG